MILKVENDRMYLAYLVCVKHLQRMQFAHSKIQHLFPMNTNSFELLPDETLSFFDQERTYSRISVRFGGVSRSLKSVAF